MENFTPVSSLLGGVLIGLSASLLLWLNGRIAGISGIINGVLHAPRGDTAWRALFLIGLIGGSAVYAWLSPDTLSVRAHYPLSLLAVGGFLVGFGTRMGSGCTSGHGVCGLGRFSRRGFAATLTFLTTGIVTVFILRHVFGVTA